MSSQVESITAAAAGTVTLGDTTVNRMGYGAMRITGPGIWGPPKDKSGALTVLRRVIELGINFIDTADSYGPGVSEELIAEALFPYPKDLVIATKGGWNRPAPGHWSHDSSPKHLREALEGSLKRLRLERIELYQLHTPDPAISFDASVQALAEMQREGKIHHIGLSNVTREHVERARSIAKIVSVQNRYSVFDREWEHVLDYCEKQKIAFIPWFPLGAGGVGHDTLSRVAEAHKAKPIQIALAWLLQRSPIMLPIPGTSSAEHLEEDIAAAAIHLTKEEFHQLDEVNGKTTAGRMRA
ncbi:MAG TPA: aldo/keto reductase [Terriglobales bacterium]|nr:aldo/keto reductase [Terriglobales bacterium]